MSPNPEKIKNFIYVSISAERHFVIRGKHNWSVSLLCS
jgi:hypothetical protein